MNAVQAISVVLPTYNGARFLAETVASVCSQSRLPDELVVVDDRSTDGSIEIVVDVCERAGVPCVVHRRNVNSGSPVVPLNEGVAAARGPWIALIDQDDLWASERLERMSAAMQVFPHQSALFFNDVEVFDGDRIIGRPSADVDRLTASGRTDLTVGLVDPAKAYAHLLTEHNFVHTASNMVFDKAMWTRQGGFDSRFRVCWDVEFLLRALCVSQVRYVPGVFTRHRAHGTSLSRSSSAESLEMTELRDRHAVQPALPIDRELLLQRVAGEWWEASYEAACGGDAGGFWRAWRRSWRLGHSRRRLIGLALKLPAYLLAASLTGRAS